MSQSIKNKVLLYSLNALLVSLALFLAYRVLGPSYVRKENDSINKLGTLHTSLAAERMGLKLMSLREELRENGLRLVDPARGPINLDTTRWLWMRIQDADWRAPKYLEPLPAAKTDVDTWDFSTGKNSFILSERIPIVKNGVQDFVLLEGGLFNSVFQDLQGEGSFGYWIFDLKAYEKNGIGAAKVFEKTSPSGTLSKEEMKLLTSDLLMELFQKQDVVSLNSEIPWVLSFKASPGPSRLGILGYWVGEAKPLDLSGIWLSLGGVMLLLSGIFSFLIQMGYRSEPSDLDSVSHSREDSPQKTSTKSTSTSLVSKSTPVEEKQVDKRVFEGLFLWLSFFGGEMKGPWRDIKDRMLAALNILQRPSEEAALEVRKILSSASSDLDRGLDTLSRFEAYFNRVERKSESIDVEIFFKRLAQINNDLSYVTTYFDPEVWRISVPKDELSALTLSYVRFLLKKSSDSKVNLSARFLSADTDDESLADIFKSQNFKLPYVRLTFHSSTRDPIGANRIKDVFDLKKTFERDEVELALSLGLLDKMGARLKVKSGFDSGNVIVVDVPASEERRAEDKVNARNMMASLQVLPDRPQDEKGFSEMPVSHTIESEPATLLSQSNIKVPSEGTRGEGAIVAPALPVEDKENSFPAIRLADIERANSFAEEISDERSRVRSRFKIRKPGEK